MQSLMTNFNQLNPVFIFLSKTRIFIFSPSNTDGRRSSLMHWNYIKTIYILLCILPLLNLLFIAMYYTGIYNFIFLITVFMLLFFITIALIFINCIQNTKYSQIFSNLIFLAAIKVDNIDIEKETKKIQIVTSPWTRFNNREISYIQFCHEDPTGAVIFSMALGLGIFLLGMLCFKDGPGGPGPNTGNAGAPPGVPPGAPAPVPAPPMFLPHDPSAVPHVKGDRICTYSVTPMTDAQRDAFIDQITRGES